MFIVLRPLMAAFLVTCFLVTASAAELTVFDVRKNFPMKNGENTFQDYYINGGSEMGIKRDMVVTVTRRRAIYDAYQNRSLGNLVVPVGKLKIIHVQNGVSVARLHSSLSRVNIPSLEYDFVLVGDQIDMTSAYFSNKSKKKKAARVAPPKLRAVQTAMLSSMGDNQEKKELPKLEMPKPMAPVPIQSH